VKAILQREPLQQRFVEQLSSLAVLNEGAKTQVKDSALRSYLIDRAAHRQLRRNLGIEAVTDEEIAAAYKARIKAFMRPERRRFVDAVFADEASAKAQYAQLMSDFPQPSEARLDALKKLARGVSVDRKSGQRDDVLPYATAQQEGDIVTMPQAIRDRGFAPQQPFDVAVPFAVDGQWHVLMLDNVRPAAVQSLEEASPQLRAQLFQERRDNAQASLLQKYRADLTIETHPEVLGKLAILELLNEIRSQR